MTTERWTISVDGTATFNPEECVKAAMDAVDAYRVAHDGEAEDEEAVTDLLADIRHLCDARDWSFEDIDIRAQRHYDAEIAGEM